MTFAENVEVWGSDCVACGNATHASQRCDVCRSDLYTVPLYYDKRAYAERLALAEGVTS